MNKIQREEMFRRWSVEQPVPTTELSFRSSFELLVAVLLSAQATDISVNKATPALFRDAPNAKSMAALGVKGITPYIRNIGLFNTKAKHLIETCRILEEKYHGEVPDNRPALEALPGVGRKTANVILNTAFKQPVIAVDTHIFRVANRTGLAPGKTPLAVEQGLMRAVPETYRLHAHHWLILHGRYTCTARKPRCSDCLVSDLCSYKDKTLTS